MHSLNVPEIVLQDRQTRQVADARSVQIWSVEGTVNSAVRAELESNGLYFAIYRILLAVQGMSVKHILSNFQLCQTQISPKSACSTAAMSQRSLKIVKSI